MKKTKILFILMIFCSLFIFSDCKKLDILSADGYYQGSFSYKGQLLFDAIVFDGSNFSEVASGGALNQKFPCIITKGTYKINHNIITFVPSVMPDCLCFECLLNGDYTLVESGNKIIFQRGTGNDLQIYNLTLIEPTPE